MPRSHNLFPRGIITILTLSGAHGVGKSTLITDLKSALADLMEGKTPDLPIDGSFDLSSYDYKSLTQFSVPSCSTAWFQQTQASLKEQGKPYPETYNDINLMGFREQMQRELPGILARKLIAQVAAAKANGGGVIFVDRWFGDIAAYSKLELSPEQFASVTEAMDEEYNMLMGDLVGQAAGWALNISLSHLYVPVEACAHEMPLGKTAEKSHRGVTPQAEWEEAYAAANHYTHSYRTVVVTAKDRLQRVAEVILGCFS
jgi:hypothetical protein